MQLVAGGRNELENMKYGSYRLIFDDEIRDIIPFGQYSKKSIFSKTRLIARAPLKDRPTTTVKICFYTQN